ncbi:MAG: carbonic anhydrase [Prevotella sp.]|jgi:carbonic anhydrase|uniref:Carbonic anhydrase 2 n=2 Tax=Dysgonomonas TaxID=156973 RepID=F5IY55_9BACT|nr:MULTISPECIES: carbonic anhydrase [Dysgonomonas]EGK01874.1 carbonic anhydrase [Dysgonomonas gadei ATCC BAA-286]MBF0651173.1 carbonic anhydrase [Dysgonomonas sp. GY75]MDR1503370.1 carbonic anhydrase [Prevotella sp.]SBV92738.1 Carbonic anhydrase 2 [uncultured Dysgonomonas sp.]
MEIQKSYKGIFEANKKWVEKINEENPDFFTHLADQQNPDYLYIGCSDSRVHANEIMGLQPGEVFVHRNIANMVVNNDLNVLSVINYAVEYLNVKYIIVCGHYNCGGIKAAMEPKDLGILNPWLRNIRDVYRLHEKELDTISDPQARYNRLVEINVYEQCLNIIKTAEVQKSYLAKGYPRVAGWVYDLNDGILHDLEIDFEKELNRIRKIYDLTKGE